MKAIIYDMQMNYLYEISGYFDQGEIEYDTGGFLIPIIHVRIGGKKEGIKCDYRLTTLRNREREAYFKFDGKDYIQISLGDVPEDYHQSQHDYNTKRKLIAYAIDDVLTKPVGINQIIETVITALLIVLVICVILFGGNLVNGLHQELAPIAKLVNLTAANQGFVDNQSAACFRSISNLTSVIRTLKPVG